MKKFVTIGVRHNWYTIRSWVQYLFIKQSINEKGKERNRKDQESFNQCCYYKGWCKDNRESRVNIK